MAEVKPWEPVMGGYGDFDIWEWEEGECQNLFPLGEPKLHVTLANGQRIIVRALSEERKAARRDRQEAM